jgi:hypothetical protein
MWDWGTIMAVVAIYVVAGGVKGLVGFGLPLVAVGLTAATVGLKEAVALVLVPAFATNVWQAWAGPELAGLVRRLWPYLAAASVTIWMATALLASGDPVTLSGALGGVLILYAGLTLTGVSLPQPGRHEMWLGPVLGAVNGAISGITGVYVIVTGPWLQMLGLRRDALIQALGLVFTFSTVVLAASMSARSLLTAEFAWLSLAAVAPALAGQWAGQKLRRALSEDRFRRVFLAALALLGAYLLVRAVMG